MRFFLFLEKSLEASMVQSLMGLCDKVGDLVLVEFLVTFFDTIGFLLSKSGCTSDLRVEFRMAICAIV